MSSKIDIKIFSSGSIVSSKSLTIVNGVCLPASCSNEKALDFSDTFFGHADLQAVSISCKNNNPIKFDFLDYFTMYEKKLLLL